MPYVNVKLIKGVFDDEPEAGDAHPSHRDHGRHRGRGHAPRHLGHHRRGAPAASGASAARRSPRRTSRTCRRADAMACPLTRTGDGPLPRYALRPSVPTTCRGSSPCSSGAARPPATAGSSPRSRTSPPRTSPTSCARRPIRRSWVIDDLDTGQRRRRRQLVPQRAATPPRSACWSRTPSSARASAPRCSTSWSRPRCDVGITTLRGDHARRRRATCSACSGASAHDFDGAVTLRCTRRTRLQVSRYARPGRGRGLDARPMASALIGRRAELCWLRARVDLALGGFAPPRDRRGRVGHRQDPPRAGGARPRPPAAGRGAARPLLRPPRPPLPAAARLAVHRHRRRPRRARRRDADLAVLERARADVGSNRRRHVAPRSSSASAPAAARAHRPRARARAHHADRASSSTTSTGPTPPPSTSSVTSSSGSTTSRCRCSCWRRPAPTRPPAPPTASPACAPSRAPRSCTSTR